MIQNNKPTTRIFIAIVALLVIAACVNIAVPPKETDILASQGQIKQFASEAALQDFLESNQDTGSYYGGGMMRNAVMGGAMAETAAVKATDSSVATPQAAPTASGDGSDYSTTNVQVEGVDEADIVKTDGSYIYVITGNKVAIVKAVPAEDAEKVSEIEVKGTPREMFVNGDKLVIFTTNYRNYIRPVSMMKVTAGSGVSGEASGTAPSRDSAADEDQADAVEADPIEKLIPFPDYGGSYTSILLYDISDRSSPKLDQTVVLRGDYFNSRMIGENVYMIANEYVYGGSPILPCVYTVKGSDVTSRCLPATDIYYFDYPDSYEFSNILAIDLSDYSQSETTVLKGSSQSLYVSEDNIYITFPKRLPYYYMDMKVMDEVYLPLLPAEYQQKIQNIKGYDITESSKYSEIQYQFQRWANSLSEDERQQMYDDTQKKVEAVQNAAYKEMEKTVVQRISVDGMTVKPEASGEVPGYVLNQFSMDQYDSYFRIATTTNQWRDKSSSNVYVLDEDMKTVGALEELAPGEQIYSARFMGDRLYLVTFRRIDPLFVIDLSDASNPTVLGKLKIPGYSNYLHPYDATHIIGIGKETEEDKEGDFSWMQGVKLALFDVSDVEHPKEVAKYEIGDRGSDSYALNDHKAFLFSKEKNLLVIPVTEAKIDEQKYPKGIDRWTYGDIIFQGAYVFNLDLEDGFVVKGKITHVTDPEKFDKSGWYWYSDGENVMRSLYIGNTLYTVSNKYVQANDLTSMEKISSVKLPYVENQNYPIYY